MINLKWFDGEEAAAEEVAEEEVVVPARAGVGGVLSVFSETVDSSTSLNCKWLEVSEAINRGWIVAVFDGAGHCDFATAVSVDDSGDDPVYSITVGSTTYSTDSPDGVPVLEIS